MECIAQNAGIRLMVNFVPNVGIRWILPVIRNKIPLFIEQTRKKNQ